MGNFSFGKLTKLEVLDRVASDPLNDVIPLITRVQISLKFNVP